MDLIEPEFEGPDLDEDRPLPPRPERRRVAVSFAFTAIVLVATVIVVYKAFPARDGELLETAVHFHKRNQWQLDDPNERTLQVWLTAVVGDDYKLPLRPGVRVRGIASIHKSGGPLGVLSLVREDQRITLLILRSDNKLASDAEQSAEGLVATAQTAGDVTLVTIAASGINVRRDWLKIPVD